MLFHSLITYYKSEKPCTQVRTKSSNPLKRVKYAQTKTENFLKVVLRNTFKKVLGFGLGNSKEKMILIKPQNIAAGAARRYILGVDYFV